LPALKKSPSQVGAIQRFHESGEGSTMNGITAVCRGLVTVAGLLVVQSVAAQDAVGQSQDEQAIRAAAKTYRAALARGDAKAVAEFWAPDGDFVDDMGNVLSAKELTAEVGQLAGRGPRSEVKVTASKIRFLTSDVAVEEGASETELADGAKSSTSRGHFHAIWVKQDGRWRLASLCEIPQALPTEPSLAEFGWMVGTWTADNDDAKLEAAVQWNVTGTFLLRDTKVIRDGKVVLRGSQRIGWDPLSRKLKSWNFDSDGGYGEAIWTRDGDAWIGQGTGVLPDGRQSSATTVITFDGKDHYTRKVIAGRIQGQQTPDQELVFTRRTESDT
jgi:uncharacterized protein (TIGR02246 family)